MGVIFDKVENILARLAFYRESQNENYLDKSYVSNRNLETCKVLNISITPTQVKPMKTVGCQTFNTKTQFSRPLKNIANLSALPKNL